MQWFVKFITSSIGAKLIVALTGAGLVGFVVAHLLGNLQIFLGAEALNAYAKGLADLGPILWVMRLGTLGLFVLHIGMAVRLSMMNKEARPVSYKTKRHDASTVASRNMLLAGLMLLCFVLYHLAHYTFGVVDPEIYAQVDAEGRHHVYNMAVMGFQSVTASLLYIAAQVLLAMHLSHGVSSMFQTLGLNHPKYAPLIKRAGPGLAIVLFLGYTSIPVAVLLGILKPEGVA